MAAPAFARDTLRATECRRPPTTVVCPGAYADDPLPLRPPCHHRPPSPCRPVPGRYGKVPPAARAPEGEPWGYHMAFDPLGGKAKWKVPLMETASSAGMLATDGGLLFTGLLTGEFIALDQDTG